MKVDTPQSSLIKVTFDIVIAKIFESLRVTYKDYISIFDIYAWYYFDRPEKIDLLLYQ